MKQLRTMFMKEAIDTLRDRRTLIYMIAIPLLIYPIIIMGLTSVTEAMSKKVESQVLKIGVIGETMPEEFKFMVFTNQAEYVLNVPNDSALIADLIYDDSLHAVFHFPDDFDSRFDSLGTPSYTMYYLSTDELMSGRLTGITESIRTELQDQRYEQLSLNTSMLEPVELERKSVASEQMEWGQLVGGMFPYFFLMFCLMGCMYPAIDLAAGEKERGTLETLLSSPVSRLNIFLGKFGVVAIAGILSAIIALIGLLLTLKLGLADDLPDEILEVIVSIISPEKLFLLIGILVPTTTFIASLMLTLSIMSKSFKEAQSKITPIMTLVILPVMVGFIPGFELDTTTALIPIVNVVLAAKEIIMGTAETIPLVITFVSLFALATVGILLSIRLFNSEQNVLK